MVNSNFRTAAWQRKEGKNPKGGLNARGRASYHAQTGGTLKAPVRAGNNPRRASFLARMGNANGAERNPDGSPTRLLLSLQAWGASSKADARAKAKAISARNKVRSNPMIDSNEIIRRPIPFGDTTQEDAVMAASVLGASAVQQSLGDAPTVQRNPAGTYDRFFTPIGNIAVKLGKFYAEGQEVARAKSLAEIRGAMTRLITAVETEDNKKTSRYHAAVLKYRTWLEDPLNRKPPSQIFTKGNKKLPFWAFSTLAGVTCPEAGACLTKPDGKRGWCYSFSAWRNIWPYFRALQNTILIRMPDKSHILNDMRKKLKDEQVVRLYVDGDMDSVDTIDFWMETCRKFPKNHFYGYSKSWQRFIDWGAQNNNNWPLNYALNLSSGSKYEANQSLLSMMTDRMMTLINPNTGQPLVRGKFIAVEAKKYPKKSKRTAETIAEYRRDVQAAAIAQYSAARTFVCPNYCGACLPNGGHACGSRKFQDVNVAIGIH